MLRIAFDVNPNFIRSAKFGISSKTRFPYNKNLNTLLIYSPLRTNIVLADFKYFCCILGDIWPFHF